MDGSTDQSSTRGVRRSSTFRYSDVRNAAEDFVFAISEHAYPIWEPEDCERLSDALTDRALYILSNPRATFR